MTTPTRDMLIEVQQTLKTALPNLSVELFPENPDQYRLNHQIGAVLVSYSGSYYQGDENTNTHRTMRDIKLHLIIIMRSLNTDQGALTILDTIHATVSGLRLTGAWSSMRCVDDKFIGNVDGTWRYLISVEFSQFIGD